MEDNSDRSWKILLALESEWGKDRAVSLTREMVLYDASKLTALRATAKVLVTSVRDSKQSKMLQQLHDDIVKLRERTGDTAPWLWINLPNETSSEACGYRIFPE